MKISKYSRGISLAALITAGACNSQGDSPQVPDAIPTELSGDGDIAIDQLPGDATPVSAATEGVPPASVPDPAPAPAPTPPAPTVPEVVTAAPASCAEIKKNAPASATGPYKIYLNAADPAKRTALDVFCNMVEDNGGWTLILNYVHRGQTNPNLVVKPTTLPLLGANSLGDDESQVAANWGHASGAMVKSLPFKELRFFCRSSENTRIIHFKTSNAACISAITDGIGHCRGIAADFQTIAGHTANLPRNVDYSKEDQGEFTLTNDAFGIFNPSSTNTSWSIRGDSTQDNWECDASNDNNSFNTIHRVWIR